MVQDTHSQGLARVTQVAVTPLPAPALERCTQLEKSLDYLEESKGKSDWIKRQNGITAQQCGD